MHRNGFTLMEVLIAITITAVIGLGVWQVLSSIVNSRDRVDDLAQQFDGLQRTILLLERDLNQVVNRPVRDLYGDFQPAMTSREEGIALALTRAGLAQSAGTASQRPAAGRLGIHRYGSTPPLLAGGGSGPGRRLRGGVPAGRSCGFSGAVSRQPG